MRNVGKGMIRNPKVILIQRPAFFPQIPVTTYVSAILVMDAGQMSRTMGLGKIAAQNGCYPETRT
jgi:hypothetical protein